MDYHIFKKPTKSKNKIVHRWHYYFIDPIISFPILLHQISASKASSTLYSEVFILRHLVTLFRQFISNLRNIKTFKNFRDEGFPFRLVYADRTVFEKADFSLLLTASLKDSSEKLFLFEVSVRNLLMQEAKDYWHGFYNIPCLHHIRERFYFTISNKLCS